MPIHDQGYRHYAGRRDRRSRVWWVIARAGLMERLRERRMLGLLLMAWLPFLVRAVQMYVASNFRQASFLAPSTQMFRAFVNEGSVEPTEEPKLNGRTLAVVGGVVVLIAVIAAILVF